MRLEGQVAIVTGAGRGIGQAIAVALAKEGADVVVNDVVVNDVDLELAKKVADEVKSVGRQAQPIKADVSNSKEVEQLVKKLYCTRLAILTYGFKSGEVVNVK